MTDFCRAKVSLPQRVLCKHGGQFRGASTTGQAGAVPDRLDGDAGAPAPTLLHVSPSRSDPGHRQSLRFCKSGFSVPNRRFLTVPSIFDQKTLLFATARKSSVLPRRDGSDAEVRNSIFPSNIHLFLLKTPICDQKGPKSGYCVLRNLRLRSAYLARRRAITFYLVSRAHSSLL